MRAFVGDREVGEVYATPWFARLRYIDGTRVVEFESIEEFRAAVRAYGGAEQMELKL